MTLRGSFKAAGIIVTLFAASYGGLIPYILLYIGQFLLTLDLLWAAAGKRTVVKSWIESPEAIAGTKVKVSTEIVNNSPWPVPWIQVWLEMPGTFGLPDNVCCYTFSLGPYQRKVVSEELECKIRGSYQCGSGVIICGGFLNIFSYLGTFGQIKEFVVLPKFCYMYGLGSRGWQGKAADSWDLRKYHSADGLSHIHWKISARIEQLLVKTPQPGENPKILVFLDNGSERHFGDGVHGSFEKAVTLTASVAATLISAGLETGIVMCSGQLPADGQELQQLSCRYGRSSLLKILRELTQVTAVDGFDPVQVLNRINLMSLGLHLVIITGKLDDTAVEFLLSKKMKGYGIDVFLLSLETFGCSNLNIISREKYILRLKGAGIRVVTIEKNSDLQFRFGRPRYGTGT